MIINRPLWQNLVEDSWKKKNIIWLMGIRRVGKTSLCQSLDDVEYFDCESPRVRQLLQDPESFLDGQRGKRVILDEIHRLENPSELLKLSADHYPDIKIVATGSSTLGASAKFKDTLTGRKKEIWLTPLLLKEMKYFGSQDIRHRFLFGGLPSFFSSDQLPEDDFKEWVDAYWAKDIQEMFMLEKRYSFQKFTELLLTNSGGQFEASRYTIPCEVSRQTISNYLSVLEATFVVHVVRPYSTYKTTEIVKAPKVYGFDTGFICFAKGWRELRQEDLGLLWEQCVLNELHGYLQSRTINYWRNKSGHEIDFIIHGKSHKTIHAIECKFSISSMNRNTESATISNFNAFRKNYPKGKNYVVANDVVKPFDRKYDDLTISYVNTKSLIDELT